MTAAHGVWLVESVEQQPQGGGGLLRNDPVPQGFELRGAGEAVDAGHVVLGQAHEPFDERGVQAIPFVHRLWSGAGERLPPLDSGGVRPP
ncbi:hypothetical protein OG588_22410 [Streptomyces prunicolor]|uniref:hypothetical protein n=1 Tax=Streptomyces prunicolor TaxID=67348 RepID=UPI0038648D6B|nr:hypothetical protein OG588_22410 [Streptomyces prunicolor]